MKGTNKHKTQISRRRNDQEGESTKSVVIVRLNPRYIQMQIATWQFECE